ncbi:MAG: beta-lactamase family protein [Blastocatellia bacterium]|nr:beta-lactamase family protein [Blastocatellia bacterium]
MRNCLVRVLPYVMALLPTIGCGHPALQTKADSLEVELDALIPKLLDRQGVPGVSIAVIRGGEFVWSKGYGLADKEKGTPVGRETRFNIGSVSKTMTAWAVMTLVEKGLVDLDAPACRYLKRWHLPESEFDNDKVTLRRLLSHTSGLSTYPASASINGYLPGEKMPTLEEALSRSYGTFGNLRVTREPGGDFQYNNGNYVILQLLIEDVAGRSFADYMKRTIFDPLGMSHTTYEWSPELRASVATPYDQNGEAWPHYQYVERGSGGVYTTASDLAQFVTTISDTRNQPAGRGILKAETVGQMISPAAGTEGKYGVGYKMFPVSNELRLISHDGANEGWRAMFLVHPQKGDGIVILANSDIGGKVAAPIICAVFARTTVDLSPLCKEVSK